MELLCVTGVEDKLQDNVRQTLELLRNAGVKVSSRTRTVASDRGSRHYVSGLCVGVDVDR